MSNAQPNIELSLQPKQMEAFYHPANELLFGGAAGGGKSHLMRVAAIIWCMLVDNLQVYIFRRLSTDLYKNHMEGVNGFNNMLEPMVRAKLAAVVQPGTIKFSNGSRIFLNHCQYEHNVTQYQGTDIHVLMIDELTHWTQPMYNFLRGRLRATGITIPEELREQGVRFPRVLCGSNPGGIGHNWVKMAFVDATLKGTQLFTAPKEQGGMTRGYLQALLEDNLIMVEDDPEYENRLYGLGNAALVEAMRHGNWDIVAGGMFDDVWTRETERRIVLAPFKLPSTWELSRSFDWGESKPFSVGWWAKTDDSEVEIAPNVFKTFAAGSWIRFHEWYGWEEGKPNVGCGLTSTAIAEGILERESRMQIRGLVRRGPADSAIFDDNDGASIAARMSAAGVDWEKADKRAGSRVQGWSLLRELLKNAAKVPAEGAGLYCFDTCQHFIRTIPTLPRDRSKLDDVDTESEDHIGDDVRYRIWKKESTVSTVNFFG